MKEIDLGVHEQKSAVIAAGSHCSYSGSSAAHLDGEGASEKAGHAPHNLLYAVRLQQQRRSRPSAPAFSCSDDCACEDTMTEKAWTVLASRIVKQLILLHYE